MWEIYCLAERLSVSEGNFLRGVNLVGYIKLKVIKTWTNENEVNLEAWRVSRQHDEFHDR
jgi:hypothetical protein